MSTSDCSQLIADCSKLPATAGLPPYLVLLRVGFALPAALLPRRCALTAPFHPYPAHSRKSTCTQMLLPEWAGRYVFCGTFRPSGLNLASRTLSGTLLCGVRTFLSPHPRAQEAAVRSGCLPDHYMRCGIRLQASGWGCPRSRRFRETWETLPLKARPTLIPFAARCAD